ncbi:hypothetical protein HUO13_19910 [Saccharopolyspora erythraea]|uniref:hypothetical protein n=1 Tax=Saccharopolyspora erythraea TaxID=1836 RepID=UPI001BAE45F0|nr:hypothetical protein [Saccharopolyspora erythraea]QUH02770.1 hypothetical protein HUO13_19910 [Saccharopolyspora erythraea]
MPTRQDVSSAASTVRSKLPSPGQAAFYGALGLGAALSVIEWPVALAVGAGTALVQRGRSASK